MKLCRARVAPIQMLHPIWGRSKSLGAMEVPAPLEIRH